MCPGLPQGYPASRAQEEGGGTWKGEEMKGVRCQKAKSSPTYFNRKEGSQEKRDCSQPMKGHQRAKKTAVQAVVPSRAGDTAKPRPGSLTDKLLPLK